MNGIVYGLELAVLLLSFAAAVCSVTKAAPAAKRLFFSAWAGAALLFAADWSLAQAPPFGNMRHVLCFFPLVLGPAVWYLQVCRNMRLLPYFAGASSVAMLGALCMPLQATWRQMPALQSPWFAPHVTAYVIAYGLLTVSAALTLVSFRREKEAVLEEAEAVVRLAFPFLTFGLCSGALWADAAWGRYWAWDIKEVWSLLTWCLYVMNFHLGKGAAHVGWRRLLLLAGFAGVVMTFLVVNFLPALESLHSYAR